MVQNFPKVLPGIKVFAIWDYIYNQPKNFTKSEMLSPLIEAKGVESSDSTKSVDEEFKNTEVEKE